MKTKPCHIMIKAPLCGAICAVVISCSVNEERGETLAAHHTAEKIKDGWSKVEKPLEIRIIDRTAYELEQIGTIGVFLSDQPDATAIEFHFDGEQFRPVQPIFADSTVRPSVIYPFRPGLHPSDTVDADTYTGPFLTGIHENTSQTHEKINVTMKLREITALLRLRIKSDNISDILKAVEIKFRNGIIAGHIRPFNGEWIETRASQSVKAILTDCMVNNGRHHDFHLVPTENSEEISIALNINDSLLHLSTTIPPLRAGSITELRLSAVRGRLNIGSSWVDSRHPFSRDVKEASDSVRVLNFLQTDGTVSAAYNSESIALVIETDGRHGKAVSLGDNRNGMMFSGEDFSTGIIMPTVDGQFNEGCYGSIPDKSCDESLIAFNPTVRYSERCAFGYRNGSLLTGCMIERCRQEKADLFISEAILRTGYIPSVFELSNLSFILDQNKSLLPSEFVMPEGFYTTSCESSESTYYAVNPSLFRISAYNSKMYPTTNLRIFYLF